MSELDLTYRDLLKRELRTRVVLNQAYSQRAFARDLDMPPHRLSEVLRGKRGISRDRAEVIATRLRYSESDSKLFCDLVEAEHGRNRASRAAATVSIQGQLQDREVLSDDCFELISKWHHLAILEMTGLPNFRFNHEWIGRKLGLSVSEVKAAVQRLIDLGLAEVHDGCLQSTRKNTHHFSNGTSHAIRDFHNGLVEQGQQAIFNQSTDSRSLDAIIFKCDPRVLPEIKAEVGRCIENVSRIARRSRMKSALYALSTNLFSLIKDPQ